MSRGLFITIDGIDGAGKTTQAKLLVQRFRKHGMEAVFVREPGGTKTCEKIRRILLDPRNHIVPRAETLLCLASRVQLLDEKIKLLVRKGVNVVSDRYLGSTICYQGAGLGLGTAKILRVWTLINDGFEPDANVILDLPVKTGLSRTKRNDRISRRTRSYYIKVSGCFRRLCAAYPKSYHIINASGGRNEVADSVWTFVSGLIKR